PAPPPPHPAPPPAGPGAAEAGLAPGGWAGGAGPVPAAGSAGAAPAGFRARPERVSRIRLGAPSRPAAGIAAHRGSAPRAPLTGELAGLARSATPLRTLAVRRTPGHGFSAVAVTWAGRRSPVSVAVRGRRDGRWTPWQAVGAAENAPDPAAGRSAARHGAELLWLGPSRSVDLAVTVPADAPVRDLAVDLIDPGDRAADHAAVPAAPAAAGTPPGGPAVFAETASGAAAPPLLGWPPRRARPPIVTRAGWGADERKMTWPPEYRPAVRAIAWHHTATANRYAAADVPKIMRSIYHFHAVSRGWGDIGYHVLVDRFGRLWEGRRGGLAAAVVGAHAGGFNSYTAGIAVIGDHRAVDVPAAAVESAARWAAWKLSLGPAAIDARGTTRLTGGGSTSRWPPGTTVTVPRIFPHRQTNHTECPGARGMVALDRLRARTRTLLGAWADPRTIRLRLAVFRPAGATWWVRGERNPQLRGVTGDLPAAADFDGDGVTDLALFRPGTGSWSIRYSTTGRVGGVRLGGPGDVPVPADTDGDGRAEPMVYGTATGLWRRAGAPAVRWGGVPGDVPVPADYGGDGRAELAVWRPTNGTWYVPRRAPVVLGAPGHVPVPADYDGDGRTDPATWSPDTRQFLVQGRAPRVFGAAGDIPVPAHYFGDGRADLAVWRVSDGVGRWVVPGLGVAGYGTHGDRPIPVS
ncbi:MAG TPA: N-acetylmuramoyl-L-alanine amidase, partial [Pilimelia sp.]|nr:N-acetylmuramoyl-L-alanine amidase [Pilimelia sp.]